jgi:hypothetical protein
MTRRSFARTALAGLTLLAAHSVDAATLSEQCATAVTKLRGAGIIDGLSVHGFNPRGFELQVNLGKWRLIDADTQSRIVHVAACYVAQGDGTLQVSGVVEDMQTGKQIGTMSLSGEYFPLATGPGFSP